MDLKILSMKRAWVEVQMISLFNHSFTVWLQWWKGNRSIRAMFLSTLWITGNVSNWLCFGLTDLANVLGATWHNMPRWKAVQIHVTYLKIILVVICSREEKQVKSRTCFNFLLLFRRLSLSLEAELWTNQRASWWKKQNLLALSTLKNAIWFSLSKVLVSRLTSHNNQP